MDTPLKLDKEKVYKDQRLEFCPFCVHDMKLYQKTTMEKASEPDSEETELRAQMNAATGKFEVIDVVEDLEKAAEYYLSFIDPKKKIDVFMDLYINLWKSAAEDYFRYKKVPHSILKNQGNQLEHNIEKIGGEKSTESVSIPLTLEELIWKEEDKKNLDKTRYDTNGRYVKFGELIVVPDCNA